MRAVQRSTVLSLLLIVPVLSGSMARAEDFLSLHLVCQGLLPGEKDLLLRVAHRGADRVTCFSWAPSYNRMVHQTQVQKWKQKEGNVVEMEIAVEIRSDGYVPREGDPASYRLTLEIVSREAASGEGVTFVGKWVEGRRSGRVDGVILKAVPNPPVRVEMKWENALLLPGSKKGGARRIAAAFTLASDKTAGAQLYERGSIVDMSYQAEVTKAEMSLEDGKLAGRIEGLITDHKGNKTRLLWRIEGQAIADKAAGTIQTTVDGKVQEPTGVFLADLSPSIPGDPSDKAMRLALPDVLGPGRNMLLFLRPGQEGLHGYATTPNFNNAIHTVDATGLKVRNGKLVGPVHLAVQADPWVPADGQGFQVPLEIEARITHDEIQGQYQGQARGRQVQGSLAGDLSEPESFGRSGKVTLKVENALVGGSKYHNRAFLSFDFKDGRITGGRVWNNHTSLGGKVSGGTFHIDPKTGQMTARVTATVDEGGKVTPGAYEFKATGVFVGPIAGGTYTSKHPATDKSKTGTCWASIKSD